MLRGIYGDPDRYVHAVLEQVDATASTSPATAPSATRTAIFWLLGRVDDVLNVAGHRIGTMEVESALVDHPKVAEAAVVGTPHEIKGQAIAAFVTLKEGVDGARRSWSRSSRSTSAQKIGAIARPDEILFAADLPEDALGQDHAPPAARHRRGQGPRRHDDAGRPAVVARLEGRVRGQRAIGGADEWPTGDEASSGSWARVR